MVEVGDAVPTFTLPLATKDSWRGTFTLRDALKGGPLVMAFYPLAFTGVCTRQVCDLRDSLHAFTDLGATVVGFSVDTAPSNMAFARDQELPFGLVSDPNREVLPALGLMADKVAGVRNVAKRAVLVIDPAGIVVWKWVTEDADEWPGLDDVRRAVEQATR